MEKQENISTHHSVWNWESKKLQNLAKLAILKEKTSRGHTCTGRVINLLYTLPDSYIYQHDLVVNGWNALWLLTVGCVDNIIQI